MDHFDPYYRNDSGSGGDNDADALLLSLESTSPPSAVLSGRGRARGTLPGRSLSAPIAREVLSKRSPDETLSEGRLPNYRCRSPPRLLIPTPLRPDESQEDFFSAPNPAPWTIQRISERRPLSLQEVQEDIIEYRIQPAQLEFLSARFLGNGGFGTVRQANMRAPNRSDKPLQVAVKALTRRLIHERRDFEQKFVFQVHLWMNLRHANILPLLGYHIDVERSEYWFISPLIWNGSIPAYEEDYGRAPFDQRMMWVQDMTEGLSYLHSQHPPLVHGDLRASNILLDGNLRAVICDFDFTRILHTQREDSSKNSLGDISNIRWSSPELLHGDSKTLKSDVWAWACTVLEIMTGVIPFSGIKNVVHVLTKIVAEPVEQGDWPSFPFEEVAWPLLTLCFSRGALQRPSVLVCQGATADWMERCVSLTFYDSAISTTFQGSTYQPTSPHSKPYNEDQALETLEELKAALSSHIMPPDSLNFYLYPFAFGGYGSVFQATVVNGESAKPLAVAVKKLRNKHRDTVRMAIHLMREIIIWHRLDHPNVLPFLGFYMELGSTENPNTYTVSQHMKHGSLREFLSRHDSRYGNNQRIDTVVIDSARRLAWMRGVTSGLHYLHNECTPPIIHGDMKAENILLNDSFEPVLCDFGLAKSPEDARHASLQTGGQEGHSLRWCSPEVLNNNEPKSSRSDIWAWACVILEISTSCTPFPDLVDLKVIERITEGDGPRPEDYPKFSMRELIWPLLAECFQIDPTLRPDSARCLATVKDWRL